MQRGGQLKNDLIRIKKGIKMEEGFRGNYIPSKDGVLCVPSKVQSWDPNHSIFLLSFRNDRALPMKRNRGIPFRN